MAGPRVDSWGTGPTPRPVLVRAVGALDAPEYAVQLDRPPVLLH